MAVAPDVLTFTGVRKRFGPTVALDGVDLRVRAGEVHALLGENGAGKSTLMNILAGVHAPDGGDMRLFGTPFAPRHPDAARRAGIAMIHQELTLAPHLSVAANVMLGRESTRWCWLQRRAMAAQTARALASLGHAEIEPQALVATLDPAARQLVEIARALAHRARVIVMDEPTSSLGLDDQRRLFAVVRRLAADGIGVIYISHFLDEVKQVADRFTVLRDGRTVGGGDVASADIVEIVEMMAGRRLEQFYPRVPHTPGEPLLQVEGLAGRSSPRQASFAVRRGEILGIAGLCGAGRTELLRVLFGLDAMRGGRVRIGADEDAGASPSRRLAQGCGLLSEDRKAEGLALGLSVATNLTLSNLRPFQRFGWLRRRQRDAAAGAWMQRLQIRAQGPAQPVGELSGGNQQKVALARLLHQDADVVLLDEPTRGIDVGSKTEIYRLIGELAAAGRAIVLVSSHIPELLGVCDRIAVMHRGVIGPARPVAEWTQPAILGAATGGEA